MTEATKAQAAAAAAGIKPTQRVRFDVEFSARVRELDARIKAINLNWSQVCRATKTARATPDRWLRRAPKSVETLAAMEAVVEAAEAEARADKF